MILKGFSVYDEKAQTYSNPVFVNNKGVALRSFMDEVANNQSQLNKHSSDFKLYEVGEFDNNEGMFKPYKVALFIANASDFKDSKNPAIPVA